MWLLESWGSIVVVVLGINCLCMGGVWSGEIYGVFFKKNFGVVIGEGFVG